MILGISDLLILHKLQLELTLIRQRGSRAGFDAFFKVYLNLVKMCLHNQNDSDEKMQPFLIISDESNQLYLNIPFAIAFFEAMSSESQISWNLADGGDDGSSSTRTQLGTLINLAEAKILPSPATFSVISPEDSFFQRELWEMNSKVNQDTTDVFADGAEIVRLTLGHFPDNIESSDDEIIVGESDGHGVISRMRKSKSNSRAGGRAYMFEVPHRQQQR